MRYFDRLRFGKGSAIYAGKKTYGAQPIIASEVYLQHRYHQSPLVARPHWTEADDLRICRSVRGQ